MKPACRRRFLWAVLVALTLPGAACTQLTGVTTSEASAKAEPEPVSNLSRGKFMLAAGEPELAMKEFLISMSVEGVSAEAMTGAGIAAQQQGLLASARIYFERARELDPNSVAAHNNLGVVLYMRKEYYPAQEAFQTAFALSSGTSGTAERNLNRVEEKIAQIEGLAETYPAVVENEVVLDANEFKVTKEDSPEAELAAE
jgi:Flp pilus assembly protein TadD